MKNQYDFEGYDVILPKGPVTLSIELAPDEVEWAFASEGSSIDSKVLKALVVAMINDPVSARAPAEADALHLPVLTRCRGVGVGPSPSTWTWERDASAFVPDKSRPPRHKQE